MVAVSDFRVIDLGLHLAERGRDRRIWRESRVPAAVLGVHGI